MASVCETCGKHASTRRLHREDPLECETCRGWRKDNGYTRPDELIVKASERRERQGTSSLDKLEHGASAMTSSAYSGPLEPPPNCTCRPDCSRLGSRLHDGLSPYCHELAKHRERRDGVQ